MPTDRQRIKADEYIKSAFRCFVAARCHLTIGEFQKAVADQLKELGGQGFVASVGTAIVAAAEPTALKHEQEVSK